LTAFTPGAFDQHPSDQSARRRNTGALTFVNSSSMGGYLLFHTCRAA
jgi:hypothetical protein